MYLYKTNEQVVTLTEEQFNNLIKTKNVDKNDVLFIEL